MYDSANAGTHSRTCRIHGETTHCRDADHRSIAAVQRRGKRQAEGAEHQLLCSLCQSFGTSLRGWQKARCDVEVLRMMVPCADESSRNAAGPAGLGKASVGGSGEEALTGCAAAAAPPRWSGSEKRRPLRGSARLSAKSYKLPIVCLI